MKPEPDTVLGIRTQVKRNGSNWYSDSMAKVWKRLTFFEDPFSFFFLQIGDSFLWIRDVKHLNTHMVF